METVINCVDLIERKIGFDPCQLAVVSSDILSRGFQVRFRANGDSMLPTIIPGDLITVKPITGRNIRLSGKIVMFTNSVGRTVVHRVVTCKKVNRKLIIQTCGDNANLRDRPIQYERIIGIVNQISRDGLLVGDNGFKSIFNRCWYLLRSLRIRDNFVKEGSSSGSI